MNRTELKELQGMVEYPSVTILLPTHRTVPDNRQDPIRMKNLLKQAVDKLSQEFTKREYQPLVDRLDNVTASIDYAHALDGLAVLANSHFSKLYYLPFPVKERVVIDRTFATRDLVSAFNRSPQYWLIALSDKSTRLFRGVRDYLAEVAEGGFPAVFQGPGGTEPLPIDYGIDRSSYLDERHKLFFREVSKTFKKLAGPEPYPLVLAGVERHIAYYNEVANHAIPIAGTLTGNHDHTPLRELSRLAGPIIERCLTKVRSQKLSELESAVSLDKYSSGIDGCWRAAHEGRISTLLVEEDYMYPAELDRERNQLKPVSDSTLPGVMDDAVDELIETVIAKGGEVHFMGKGLLSIHNHIAAIMRY
ncbi:MAG: hypothetical protein QME66_08825 [Candidatus Eisenbacteria bacterium]|nr:hypothetical protein [Candidatus Eisenbacteria bacterium]